LLKCKIHGSKNMNSPSNSWASFRAGFKEADETIKKTLKDQPMGVWLDKTIHELIWHDAVCVVRWINQNKELVLELNQVIEAEEFKKLLPAIRLSTSELKKY
jgi:hypothetical protein